MISYQRQSSLSIDEDGQIDDDSILFEFVITQADILKTLVEKIEYLEKENGMQGPRNF